jgi:hypothetical protein
MIRPSRIGFVVLFLLVLLISIVFFVHYPTVSFLLRSIWFYLFLIVIAVIVVLTSLRSTRSS